MYFVNGTVLVLRMCIGLQQTVAIFKLSNKSLLSGLNKFAKELGRYFCIQNIKAIKILKLKP